jgi:DNA-binding SARP family transcriptional activator
MPFGLQRQPQEELFPDLEPPEATVLLAVLAAIAVLADDGTLAAISHLVRYPATEVSAAVDRLCQRNLLIGDPVLRFATPELAHDIAAGMSKAEAEQLHARAAEYLHEHGARLSAIGHHLELAAPIKEPWVIDVLRQAARERRRAGDQVTAANMLRRALAESPPVEIARRLLVELASAEARLDPDDAIERYEEALALTDEAHERFDVRLRLATCLGHANRVHDALEEADLAAKEAPTEVDRRRANLTYIALARQSLETRPLGPPRLEALRHESCDSGDPLDRSVLAEVAYEQCLAGEPRDLVIEAALAGLGGPSMSGVHDLPGLARHVAILSLMWSGDLRHADLAVQMILTRAARRGDRVTTAGANQLMTLSHWLQSRLHDVITAADAALIVQNEVLVPTLPANRANKALAAAYLGETDTALALLELPGGERRWMASASFHGYLVGAAHVALVLGDYDRAYREATRCGALTKAMGTLNPAVVPWQPIAALAASRCGLNDTSACLAGDALVAAQRFGAPWCIGVALHAAGCTADDPERARALLQQAVDVTAGTPFRLHLARCHQDLGTVLAALGRREDADTSFATATTIAAELGAKALESWIARDSHAASSTRTSQPAAHHSGGVVLGPQIRVLGAFCVLDAHGNDATPVGVPGKALRVLIAAGRPLHSEELADRLWDDAVDPSQLRARLRNVLARARTPDGPLIVRQGELLALSSDVAVDVDRFEQAAIAAQARQDEPGALEAALAAVTLYGGDLFPTDPFADWALLPREQLRRRYLAVVDLASRLAADAQMPELAVDLLESAIRHDPHDDSRYLRAATIEENAGRYAAARVLRRRARQVAEALDL